MLQEYIASHGRETWSWILQEAQNVASFSQEVPSRIASKSSAKKARQRLLTHFTEEKLQEFLQCPLKGMEAAAAEQEVISALLAPHISNLWITEGVYSNPLLTQFREYDPWRIWEQVWIIDRVSGTQQSDEIEVDTFAKHGFGTEFLASFANLTPIDAVLIVGPVWRFQPADEDGPKSGIAIIQSVVDAYIHQRRRLSPEEDREKISVFRGRMLRWGGERAAITSPDLRLRTRNIASTFDTFIETNVAKDCISIDEGIEEFHFHANLWGGVAQLSLLLQENYDILSDSGAQSFTFLPPTLSDLTGTPVKMDYLLVASLLTSGWCISISSKSKALQSNPIEQLTDLTGRIGNLIVPTDAASAGLFRRSLTFRRIKSLLATSSLSHQPTNDGARVAGIEIVEMLDASLSRLVDRIQGTRESYILERQALVRYRLEDEWSRIPPANRSPKFAGKSSSIAPQLITAEKALETICYTLNASACFVYRYDYPERKLRDVGHFITDPSIEDEWSESIASALFSAGSDNAAREQSICYQAVDSGERVVLLDARGHVLLPENCPIEPGSAMVIPIRIYGRTWGVLEIICNQPYRLRQSTIRYAHEYARLIGGYLHQHWLQREVLLLTHSLHIALKDEVAGEEIASNDALRSLSQIFMVEQVSVWRPKTDIERKRTFQLKWHEGHDVSGTREFDENSAAVGASLIARTDLWFSGNFKDKRDRVWLPGLVGDYIQCRREDPAVAGYAVIKVNNGEGKTTGIVWLIGYQAEAFDWRWGNFLAFFSEYLDLLFNLIEHQKAYKELQATDRKHEIGGQVRALQNVVDGIIGAVSRLPDSDRILVDGPPAFANVKDALEQHGISYKSLGPKTESVMLAVEKFFMMRKLDLQHPEYTDDTNTGVLLHSANRLQDAFEELKRRVRMLDAGEGHHVLADRERVNFNRVINESRISITGRKSVRYSGATNELRLKLPFFELIIIMRNLFENAVKYNCANTAPTAASLVDQGNYWKVVIRNFGLWMPAKEFDEIDKVNKRSSWSQDMSEDGQGKGLYIASQRLARYNLELVKSQDEVQVESFTLNKEAIKLKKKYNRYSKYEFGFVIPWDKVVIIKNR